MKTIRQFLAIIVLALAILPASAQVPLWPHNLGIGGQNAETTVFSGRSGNDAHLQSVHSNLAYFITSAAPAGVPRVTYLSVFTDAGTVVPLTAYTSTNSVTVTNYQALSTNRFGVASTATLSTNDFLILRGSNDVYQLLTISNIDSATVFATYEVATNGVNVNDIFYEQTATSTINIANLSGGSTTQYSHAAGVFQGTEGKPLLITVGASNATPALHVSGEYYRRLRP